MANFNKVVLLGNLTADPEVRYTPRGTAVTDLRMAINRVWNDDQNQRREETTYLDVTLWGRQAEIAGQYLSKGRPVLIEGRLQMDTWEDKTSGQKRSRLKVVGENMQLLSGSAPGSPGSSGGGSNNGNGEGGGSHPKSTPPSGGGSPASDEYNDLEDDDIPF